MRRVPWAALAFIGSIAGTAHAPAQTVAVGELGIVADAPFYIGIEKGYFRKVGITLSLQRFASAAQTTLPLSSDKLQVAGGGMSAGLFNAFARGLPIRIAMARTRDTDAFSSDTLSVRADLRGTIATFADLKGRKIAINAPAAALEFMVGKMLQTASLGLKDADITYMPWPDMGTAFANKGIDAGTLVEPFTTQYADRKLAFPFGHAADVFKDPPLEVSVILFSKTWIDRSPAEAREFSIAYLEGVRDYYDAMRVAAQTSRDHRHPHPIHGAQGQGALRPHHLELHGPQRRAFDCQLQGSAGLVCRARRRRTQGRRRRDDRSPLPRRCAEGAGTGGSEINRRAPAHRSRMAKSPLISTAIPRGRAAMPTAERAWHPFVGP